MGPLTSYLISIISFQKELYYYDKLLCVLTCWKWIFIIQYNTIQHYFGIRIKFINWDKNTNLLKLCESYMFGRKQRILINNQSSCAKQIPSDVPRGSLHDPILFCIYVSDIVRCVTSNIRLFVDGISFFVIFVKNLMNVRIS